MVSMLEMGGKNNVQCDGGGEGVAHSAAALRRM